MKPLGFSAIFTNVSYYGLFHTGIFHVGQMTSTHEPLKAGKEGIRGHKKQVIFYRSSQVYY
jgi:hypothetical protein